MTLSLIMSLEPFLIFLMPRNVKKQNKTLSESKGEVTAHTAATEE